MRAKFDNILVPIAGVLIDSGQRDKVKFDAFFPNVMFHEVGHGLGIKQTITGKGSVRNALKDRPHPIGAVWCSRRSRKGKHDVFQLFRRERSLRTGSRWFIQSEFR